MPVSCDKQNSKTVSGVSRGPTPKDCSGLLIWYIGMVSFPQSYKNFRQCYKPFLLYHFHCIKLYV